MKKIVFSIAFLAAALTITLPGNAQEKEHKEKSEPKYKKEKSYSKSYSLSGSDKISLSNQFGEMKLNTWDKNEIKVDVSITGKSDDEQRAQEILDRISILDSKESGTVSFKTKFTDETKKENSNRNRKDGHNEGMEINYVVYLPANNSLNVENQFGKLIVPDYRGEMTLECKFGSLTAGKISNAKEVNIEFGSADIAQVNGGKLSVKFSSATINKLSGNVDSDLEFSTVKLVVENDAKSLDINNSYSDVYLDLDKNLSASYDIITTHGSFSNKTAFAINSTSKDDKKGYGPNFTKEYSGTSGGGGLKIKVRSSFGSITAGHNLEVDMSKKGNKSGKRTRTI